jgi:hypothetical protein
MDNIKSDVKEICKDFGWIELAENSSNFWHLSFHFRVNKEFPGQLQIYEYQLFR